MYLRERSVDIVFVKQKEHDGRKRHAFKQKAPVFVHGPLLSVYVLRGYAHSQESAVVVNMSPFPSRVVLKMRVSRIESTLPLVLFTPRVRLCFCLFGVVSIIRPTVLRHDTGDRCACSVSRVQLALANVWHPWKISKRELHRKQRSPQLFQDTVVLCQFKNSLMFSGFSPPLPFSAAKANEEQPRGMLETFAQRLVACFHCETCPPCSVDDRTVVSNVPHVGRLFQTAPHQTQQATSSNATWLMPLSRSLPQ